MKTTGYKESLEQYKDLVDKKGFGDYLGDAFSRVGSGPAQGASQRMSNAILSGLGAGVSGAAADQRKEMLSPYLEQAGRITAKAAELEAQMQQAQSYQLAINEFGQKYTPLVAEFAAAVNSNDPRATMMFKDLVNKAQMIPGFENLEGDSWNPSGGFGLALNTETGEYRKITADEIVSAVAPAAQTIYGDQWFEKFMPLNAGFAKDAAYAFNMKRQEDALGLEGKRADIGLKQADTNLKQAHAGVYQQQASQIQNEMANPKLSPEEYKANMDTAKFNRQLIQEEIKPKLVANEAILDAYESLGEIAKESPDIIGSDLKTKAYRMFGQAWGLDPNIDYANLKAIEFEKMLKPILGAQLGEKEGERVLSKFASIGNNKVALEKFLKKEIPKVTEDIVEAKQLIDAFNKVQYANLYDNAIFENKDQAIEQYNQERENKKRKQEEESGEWIKIQGPSGEVAEVHFEDAPNFLNKPGYTRVK